MEGPAGADLALKTRAARAAPPAVVQTLEIAQAIIYDMI